VADRSKPYRFESAARADLRQGVLWYEEQREGLGGAFSAYVGDAIKLILTSPQRWPIRRGTHRYVLLRFPYTIA
jgi:hypothetical protein